MSDAARQPLRCDRDRRWTSRIWAALYGSAAGLNVAVIEKDKVGSTCLHRGCIPAKSCSDRSCSPSRAAKFGVESSAPTLAFATTMARKTEVVTGLFNGLSGLLKSRKVTVFGATGTLQADRSVHLSSPDGDSQTITGDAVILASGSVPRTIPGFDVDGRTVLTSDGCELDQLPAKVAVIGGGAIGCEFASMLSDLGSEVTILEALPQILPGVDKDVVNMVRRSFKGRGIDVRTGTKVLGHTPGSTGTSIQIDGADALNVEAVVVSVGRKPLSDSLGLLGTGVVVDDGCRSTSCARPPSTGSGRSVTSSPRRACASATPGVLVIKRLLGEPSGRLRQRGLVHLLPARVFAGMSEQAAIDAGYQVMTRSTVGAATAGLRCG